MGYTTDFIGSFNLDKPLAKNHLDYLVAFASTRRMARNPVLTNLLPDSIRLSAGLPVGIDGGFYVGGAESNMGQERTNDIINYNSPPNGQTSLWCQWVPNEDGTAIEWDNGEKFYSYIEWIEYLINNFLAPWGYKLNGEVIWQGEDTDDMGKIVIKNNKVKTKQGKIVYS